MLINAAAVDDDVVFKLSEVFVFNRAKLEVMCICGFGANLGPEGLGSSQSVRIQCLAIQKAARIQKTRIHKWIQNIGSDMSEAIQDEQNGIHMAPNPINS